ncbi:RPM1 interacting protein 13-like [Salvia miltiorrhiza]|uniref:RPM1 interacting protein 13-like n=1 Tax=Salvia miltiorrhiza TaxID=226208 RepID=UPI0025ACAF9F|nr:RPM1 interacting protein 13-like [Salvia miltiorrhiza]
MGSKYAVKKRRVQRDPKMAVKQEVIEIDDSCPSPVQNGTPLRPMFCLKNREEIKKFEQEEECFILEFDPYHNLDVAKLPSNAEAEFSIVAETGQVACRDYPHPRNTCAKFPFNQTPHDKHCKMCYCYVCDLSAPCLKWTGSSGHCHAFKNEAWDDEKRVRRQVTKTV